MKNLKTFALFFASALICASTFTACKKGNAGKDGTNGTAGTAGATGAKGTNGTTGINGNTMLNGSGTPADTLGVAGDFYLDIDSRMLYGPKTSEGWGTGESIQGPAGDPGPGTNISVDTFTIKNAYWTNRDTYNFTLQTAVGANVVWPGMNYMRFNPAITDSILTTGLLIVDVKLSPDYDVANWTQLPYSAYAGTFDMNVTYREANSIMEIAFYYSMNANEIVPSYTDVEALVLPDYQVKVVTIPSTIVIALDRVMTTQKLKAKAKVN